jgi:hemerythrin-like domain-containing protein
MKQEDKRIDPLKRFIKDHEDVSEFVENLEEILGFLYEKLDQNNIKRIEDFFNRNIICHFKFEENEVFPKILSGAATSQSIKLILELQKEHGMILKQLESFQKIVAENRGSLDKETNRKIGLLVKKITEELQKHAAKEDDNLLPLLKENRQLF